MLNNYKFIHISSIPTPSLWFYVKKCPFPLPKKMNRVLYVSQWELKFLIHVIKNILNGKRNNQELGHKGSFKHGKGFGHRSKGIKMLLKNLIPTGSLIVYLLNFDFLQKEDEKQRIV